MRSAAVRNVSGPALTSASRSSPPNRVFFSNIPLTGGPVNRWSRPRQTPIARGLFDCRVVLRTRCFGGAEAGPATPAPAHRGRRDRGDPPRRASRRDVECDLPARRSRTAIATLRSASSAAGRAPTAVTATVSFRLIVRDDTAALRARAEELDPEWREDPYRIQGSTEEVVEVLGRYVEAGADGLIVQMPAPFDLPTLERLAAQRTTLAGSARSDGRKRGDPRAVTSKSLRGL